MKRNRVLFMLLPLLVSTLSGCRGIFVQYYGSDYTDDNGFIYRLQNNGRGVIVAVLKSVPSGLTEVTIPDEINGVEIAGIEQGASFPDVEILNFGRNIKGIGYDYHSGEDEMENSYFYSSYYEHQQGPCNWPNLKKVSFANSQISSIPQSCFLNCTKLESVTFNEDLKYIESCAFYGCKKLKNPTFPSGLKVISDDAFSNCSLIDKTLRLPNDLMELGSAFENTGIITNYTSEHADDIVLRTYDDCLCLISEGSNSDSYSYSEETNTRSYTSNYNIIGGKALSSIGHCSTVTFNSQTISHEAIRNRLYCDTLILNSTRYIGKEAFNYSFDVDDIVIHGDVQYIGSGAFEDDYLKTISIDNNPSQKYFTYNNVLYGKSANGYNLLMMALNNESTTLTLSPKMTGIGHFMSSYLSYPNKVYDVINLFDNNLIGLFGIEEDYYDGDSWNNNYFLRVPTKEYNIIGNSDTFKIINGSIYKGSALLKVPAYREVETYTVSSSCERIATQAFSNIKTFNCVKLSRQVKTIEYNAFYDITSKDADFSLYIPKEVEKITGQIISNYHLNKTAYDEYYGDYYEYTDTNAKPIVYVESNSMKENWAPECFEGCEVVWGYNFDY